MAFRVKQLENEPTLGDELKYWREKRGLSLNEASLKANVQEKYIRALEKNEYSDLPEPLYAKNFLKAYLKILGLKESRFLKTFDKERRIAQKKDNATVKKKPVNQLSKTHLIVAPRVLKIILASIVGLAIIIYLVWQIDLLLKPPGLVIYGPPDDITTAEAQIEITGKVDAEALLEINNQEVVTDSLGNFEHALDLQRGLNIVTIKAWKRHSRENVLYRKIILEQE